MRKAYPWVAIFGAINFKSALVAIAAMSLLSACGPQKKDKDPANDPTVPQRILKSQALGFYVTPQWISGPKRGFSNKSHLALVTHDIKGNPLDLPPGIVLEFHAIMESMGHGAKDNGQFYPAGFGLWENKDIRFGMGGDWKIEIHFVDANRKMLDKVSWEVSF